VNVSYELTSAEANEFVCHAADGSAIRVDAGKTFTTSDPKVIAELDAQSQAVKRVKKAAE
jgi:hypothetical protein